MKMFLSMLGVLALLPVFTSQAQNKDLFVWIEPRLGTLVGGGYVSSYLTNIHAKTMAADAPSLRNAIQSTGCVRHDSREGFLDWRQPPSPGRLMCRFESWWCSKLIPD